MKKISSSTLLNIFTKLLILVLVAKAIGLSLWFYLPSDGQELKINSSYQPKYQRVDFKNMIEKTQKKVVQKEIKKEPVKVGISITNMILKGLYGVDEKGFAIVALKSKPKKTTIVEVGEIFEGYKLRYINSDGIVFTKDEKDYILNLVVMKNKSSITKVRKVRNSPNVQRMLDRQKAKKAHNEDSDEPRGVSRSDIAYFAKNPKQIWREISIKEVKKNGKIMGFKIRKIAKRSKFAELGLQRGDIIIRANNIKLTSYRDAIKLYREIDKIDTMEIVVLRNNQEKELIYEIN